MMNNLLSGGLALQPGVAILIMILTVLAVAGLTVWLRISTKRERARRINEADSAGALSKDAFDALLQQRFKYANTKTKFTVFYIELGNAKEIKESFGEMQYKTAIHTLRERVNNIFNARSKISEYTYDSLLILVDADLGRIETEDYCRFIITACNQTVRLVGNLTVEFDVNIGVAGYNTYNYDYVSLWQNLELALVSAVRSGVNTYVIHTSELSNSQSDEYKYYQEIKSAIAHNEFTVYYHSIMDIETNKIFGYESLLRWNHKELGVLAPNKFLNILEQSGDINWVGTWAYEQVVLQQLSWAQTHKDADLVLTVNLSSKQLTNEKLFDDFRQISRKYKIEPSKICFEIMEFALYEKVRTVKENIEKLTQAGYLIAIDNYGLELSTLSILKQLKIDFIKLDKEFISQAMDSLNSGIINMLINFARENNIKMVAEGIETAEMLEFLKGLGIKYGQGYYFAQPRPAIECESDFAKK